MCLSKFAGFEIVHHYEQQAITQTAIAKINNMLAELGISDCKGAKTPYIAGQKMTDLFTDDLEVAKKTDHIA